MAVELAPIVRADIPRVAQFLHANMDSKVPAEQWRRLIDVRWEFEGPNRGFMLVDDGAVVGAYLAYYSVRNIGEITERLCNLGTWSVLPAYRSHSLRLLHALLAQDGYLFTDFTPDRNVIEINLRLGFRWLRSPTVAAANLPWPSWPGRVMVSSDPTVIERTLSEPELRIYRDHRVVGTVRSVVLRSARGSCHVVYRRIRRFGLPVAVPLHVSDPELLHAHRGPFARHLLVRHRTLARVVEARIAGRIPRLAIPVRPPRRMLRGGGPEAARVDYLYSELARLSW